MQEKSYICKFLSKHPNDWEDLLKAEPYALRISKEDNLAIFNYAKITTAGYFCNPLVQEARGIIVDAETLNVVCWPFRKFGNYGEEYADDIDWKTARIQEKADGCIMKLWYDRKECKWRVSSNSRITPNDPNMPLGKLFWKAAEKQKLNLDKLGKESTYIFELVGPENRIVIPYPETLIIHTGTRNNQTGEERNEDIGIRKPKEYPLHSLKECLAAAESLNKENDVGEITEEGFVVVDDDWHRIKIKSPLYVLAHLDLTGTPPGDTKRAMIILAGEDTELLAYRKELISSFEETRKRLGKLEEALKRESLQYRQIYVEECGGDRRLFARRIKGEPWEGIAFPVINGQSVDEILSCMKKRTLREYLRLANEDVRNEEREGMC